MRRILLLGGLLVAGCAEGLASVQEDDPSAGASGAGGGSGGGAVAGSSGAAGATAGGKAGTAGSGAAGSSGTGNAGAGNSGGAGNAGSGNAGAGNAGAGNAGSGNAGAGNAGSGNAGSGNAGAGNAGSGNAGAGNAGSGNAGAGNAGSGNAGSAGSGNAGSAGAGNAGSAGAGNAGSAGAGNAGAGGDAGSAGAGNAGAGGDAGSAGAGGSVACPVPTEACSDGAQSRTGGCKNARVIGRTGAAAGGYTKNDSTCSASDAEDEGDSSCWDAGADLSYRVFLSVGDTLQIVYDTGKRCINSNTYDGTLKIYEPTSASCAAITGKCTAAGGALSRKLCEKYISSSPRSFTATVAGWHYVIVDGSTAFDDEGDHKFKVTLTCATAGCGC